MLFVPPSVQLDNYRIWNTERNLGFSDADFDAIDLSGPWYHGGLVVDVIVGYLSDQDGIGGVQRTFDETWDIASSRLLAGYPSRYVQLKSDPRHLRLMDGIEHTPGLRRVTLDLGANQNKTKGFFPREVRGKDLVHAEALAAAAHFPEWVQAMAGDNVPAVWMPGYEVNFPGNRYMMWHCVPYLYLKTYRGRYLKLSADHDDDEQSSMSNSGRCSFACPVVVRR